MVKGILIQYKFVLPAGTKHSSYTYQKLFRAIYGYTQNVSKSTGKTYHYHRAGVLSPHHHTKPGKNTVVIPKNALPAIVDFFKTGKNPSHEWHVKGDWKAVYYTDEREISPQDAAEAINTAAERILISIRPASASTQTPDFNSFDEGEKTAAHAELSKLIACEWFRECGQNPKTQKILELVAKR